MYKPPQKKNSSWTPSTVQKKGKSPSKLGHFSIQPKSNPSSTSSQEIGEYSRDSADRLTANVMRGIQAKKQEEAERLTLSEAEGSTLQPKFESPWAPTFEPPPPLPESPASKLKGAFAPVSKNPIQRQCADCAKEEKEQVGEEKKDLEEIGIQTKLTIGAPGDTYEQEADRVASQVMSMSAPPDSSASVQLQLDTNHPHHPKQIWQRAQSIKPVMQRQIDPRVQMRQMIQRAHQIDGNQASGNLENRLNASKGGGSPLSEDVRGFMEPRFGADFSGVRVHTGGEAVQMNQELGAQAFTHGSDVYFGAGEEPGNNELTAHELTHVVQQSQVRVNTTTQLKGLGVDNATGLEYEVDATGAKSTGSRQSGRLGMEAKGGTQVPVQMRIASAPLQIQKAPSQEPSVPIDIRFKANISGEEFKQIAMKQLFGGPIENVVWSSIKPSYKASDSPVKLLVSHSLLKRYRAEVNEDKGIDIDDSGGVEGAEERRKDFRDTATQEEKSEINQEIDQRYYAVTGDKPGTKITSSKADEGKRKLWLQLRDEVLFQREYAKNLPPKVQKFLKESIRGRVMTAKDYEQLFRIGKMIESLPADISQDYLSKITNSTTDLSQFEASLHQHVEAHAKNQAVIEENLENSQKLAGLDEVYKKYRLWKTLIKSASGPGVGAGGIVILREAGKLREEIDIAVKKEGFSSVEDFEFFIKKFEKSFTQHSQVIALNLIDKLQGKLYKEQQRYTENSELKQLLALIKSGKTKEKLSRTYPIFQEEELPDDKKIDLEKLRKMSTSDELGTYLTAKVNERQQDAGKARGHIDSDPNVIFKLDKLMPQFFLQQDIAQGSIHQMIIEDKLKDDAITKLVVGIATAIVAIALAVISLGTAIPAIVAAGAAAAGFGLSAYMAYEEYKNYTLENDLTKVGFADDPSLVWLIIAVAGAVLDLGAAVKAVNAIGKGAKALDATKDLAVFEKVLAEARKAGKIDAKISDAVISAAKARIGYTAASDNLTQILINSKGLKNFLDPQVYIELVKMAKFKAQQGVTNFNHYLLEIRKMRKAAKIGDLSGEELLKVKQAWAEGRALAGLTDDALKGADGLVKPVKDAVIKRITGDTKFAFTHTDEELRAIIAKGKAVGLSQKEIEHLIFTSCRKDKPLNAIQLMNQIDFHKYLKSRGFPAKFKNMKDFDDFKSFLRDQFSAIGVKTDDLRIQGSAVRSATADDIDAAAMISHSDFDNLIKKIYGTKLKENNVALDLKNYSHDDLAELAKRIDNNPKSFNGTARQDFYFNFTNKIIQPIPKKKAVYQAMDLGRMLEALQKRFPHLNIDNFTIQVRGGKYDSYPFWQL